MPGMNNHMSVGTGATAGITLADNVVAPASTKLPANTIGRAGLPPRGIVCL